MSGGTALLPLPDPGDYDEAFPVPSSKTSKIYNKIKKVNPDDEILTYKNLKNQGLNDQEIYQILKDEAIKRDLIRNKANQPDMLKDK